GHPSHARHFPGRRSGALKTPLEEDLRPFFPDKRTTIPDVKQGILEGLKLRQTVMERQKGQGRGGENRKKG
ncbi:hypothetical protein NE659_27740, partial [Flavonifractor plautii]|uniref:hypothetical protein n=1 Tax=Flavonifractor plautii TaxID=292800 RepID=UPI002108EFD6